MGESKSVDNVKIMLEAHIVEIILLSSQFFSYGESTDIRSVALMSVIRIPPTHEDTVSYIYIFPLNKKIS